MIRFTVFGPRPSRDTARTVLVLSCLRSQLRIAVAARLGHWLINSLGHFAAICVTLVLRLIQSSAGIAGKDFGEIRGLWPETANAFPTAASPLGSGHNKP